MASPFGGAYQAVTLQGYDALQRRLAALGRVDQTFMRDLGALAVREQKRLLYTEAVQRRTGHSGQLVRLSASGPVSATTEADGTAAFADTGTKPHTITPKAKKALRWATSSSKGFRLTGVPKAGSRVQWQFASIVHHPGTKAHPYMLRGAQMAVDKTGAAPFVTAWNTAA